MNGRVIVVGLFATAVLLGQEIHLKTRTLETGSLSQATTVQRSRPQREGSIHQIVQFDHAPGVDDLNALASSGARVVAMVPDNALMVFAPYRMSSRAAGANWIGELDPADKLSPKLSGAAAGTTGEILAIVEFHGDVQLAAREAVAALEGVKFQRPAVLLANHAIVNAPMEKLQALAEHDEVAYIFPADPALTTAGNDSMPCGGLLTLAGPIAQYANIVTGWSLDSDNVAHLGYVFGTLTSKFPAATVQSEILRALNAWSQVANVVFQVGTDPDASRTVLIKFASGSHGDPYPFDVQGEILAHTFYPVPVNPESIAGDMHLNADENWNVGGDIDIYSVALHEAGHAIGLTHSDNPGDVMYPYYRRGMQLSANDIGAAQELYGAAGPSSAPAAAPPAAITAPAPVSPSVLSLILNPVTHPGQAAQVSVSGTVSGGVAPMVVEWQTDQGYSGSAAVAASGLWSATVPLVTGSNMLTVTALDSAHGMATQTASITRMQSTTPVVGSAPVSISITTPAGTVVSTSSATISLGGTASGGSGVTQVTWQTSGGASGTGLGVDRWTIANIPLLIGTNTIIVRAIDAKGANAWAAIVVVRQ
jgi:hypothetical protein